MQLGGREFAFLGPWCSAARTAEQCVDDAALAEAARCFSCGTCIACDNCFHYCPDLAIRRLPDGGYEVDGNYCKGCGICVRECPTGSMEMIEEVK